MRIINTRAQTQSASLTESLSLLGAEIIEAPMIAFVAPADEAPIREALTKLQDYDWLIFTSVNAVEHFCAYLDARGIAPAEIRARIASVGKATSAALQKRGFEVDLVPTTQATAEGLVDAFGTLAEMQPLEGMKFLMPRAQEAREILPEWLREQGAHIDVAPVYQTTACAIEPELIALIEAEIAEPSKTNAVIFTSPSTCKSFISSLTQQGIDPHTFARSFVAFSVGPVTTAEISRQGLAFAALVEAQESYLMSLIEAIKTYASAHAI